MTDKSLSDDAKYDYLFNNTDSYKWKRPSVIRLGLSNNGNKNFLISMDVESRFYKETDININVWEYAGTPDWSTVWIFSGGFELFPFLKTRKFHSGQDILLFHSYILLIYIMEQVF